MTTPTDTDALIARLLAKIDIVKQDIADDKLAAETTGEPVSLWDYCVELSPDEAEALADAIHTLRQRNARLVEGLEEIEGQALCHGMRADEAELRSWLENIAGITARTLIEDNSNG